MKKLLTLALLWALTLTLCACGGADSTADDAAETTSGGGINEGVTILPAESDLYTQEDIDAAIDVTLDFFRQNFTGCTLTELGYAGDAMNRQEAAFLNQYGGDELIVLLSSFDVDASGGDGSLNPNETYSNWNWILVRDSGGQWRHADHGYG